MYLFVPCDKKSHRTEISFPIRSNHLSHPHPPQHGAVTSGWNVSLYSIQDTPPCCPYMVSINKTREYSSK